MKVDSRFGRLEIGDMLEPVKRADGQLYRRLRFAVGDEETFVDPRYLHRIVDHLSAVGRSQPRRANVCGWCKYGKPGEYGEIRCTVHSREVDEWMTCGQFCGITDNRDEVDDE